MTPWRKKIGGGVTLAEAHAAASDSQGQRVSLTHDPLDAKRSPTAPSLSERGRDRHDENGRIKNG